MYFRIGGTYADRIVFTETDGVGLLESDMTFFGEFGGFNFWGNFLIVYLASDYLKVYQFTQNAGVRLLYDLNSLLRNEDGSWNSENAEEMIKFSNDNHMELDWELGNGRLLIVFLSNKPVIFN